MKISIITPGKAKHNFLKEGEAEFIKRLERFTKIEILELDTSKFAKLHESELVKAEGELILSKIPSSAFICLLDELGKTLDSRGLADLIQKETTGGKSHFVFVIGGPFGSSPAVKERAHFVLALSRLTFTAQLARFIMVEQIYRSFSIIKGLPYHKD